MSQVNDPSGVQIPTYTMQVEDTGTYKYIGEADPGTATSAALWRLCRITNASSTILYAAGGAFTQTWDGRASATYA